jgi:hypothetical protein
LFSALMFIPMGTAKRNSSGIMVVGVPCDQAGERIGLIARGGEYPN